MRRCLILLLLVFCAKGVAEEDQNAKMPFNFVYDVAKPIGMPIVTSYHAMRENIFLNLKIKGSSTLEEIGDFFLTPSQYLFAGKTIYLHPQKLDYEIVQSFNYNRLHWLKSLLSLIVLPIAEPIGVALKGLAYFSSDVRARYEQAQKVLHSQFATPHLTDYIQRGISALQSEEYIPCQGHKRPSYLSKNQKTELKAFQEIVTLLDAHNIPYWIDCGTCLGAYRYGGMIPWDIDIDLAIMQADHENVKRLLSTLDPEKYQIQDWSSYSNPGTFLKLYVKETKNLIDIYHYQFDENDNTISYFYSYENSPFPNSWKKGERKCTKPLQLDQIFPLKRATFDQLTVWAPNRVVEYLQTKFGENLDPSMLWDEETNAYVKVQGHPYWKD